MERVSARSLLISAVVAVGLAGCGGGSIDTGDEGLASATAVSANSSDSTKAANKVDPAIRPGVEAPLDSAPESADRNARTAIKLFATGFEQGVSLTAPEGIRLADQQLVGSDTPGFELPLDFWATPAHWRNWVLSLTGENGTTPMPQLLGAALETVPGRHGAATRALSLHKKPSANVTGPRQVVVQNVGMGIEAVLYQRMWIKFDPALQNRLRKAGPDAAGATFWEAIARPDYRIRIGLTYDQATGLQWHAAGDLMDGAPAVWQAKLASVPVVLAARDSAEGWHKIEIWMDRPAGRFKVAVDGAVLADVTANLLGKSGNRLDILRLMMAEGTGLGETLFDDLELWDTPPADAWSR